MTTVTDSLEELLAKHSGEDHGRRHEWYDSEDEVNNTDVDICTDSASDAYEYHNARLQCHDEANTLYPDERVHTLFRSVSVPAFTWTELPQRWAGSTVFDITARRKQVECSNSESCDTIPTSQPLVLRIADMNAFGYPWGGHEHFTYDKHTQVDQDEYSYPDYSFTTAPQFRVVILTSWPAKVFYSEAMHVAVSNTS
jgi:hypothetical protein